MAGEGPLKSTSAQNSNGTYLETGSLQMALRIEGRPFWFWGTLNPMTGALIRDRGRGTSREKEEVMGKRRQRLG